MRAAPTASIILHDREQDFHRQLRRRPCRRRRCERSPESERARVLLLDSRSFRAITSRSRPPTIHHRATSAKEKSLRALNGIVDPSTGIGSALRSIRAISARVPPTRAIAEIARDEEISFGGETQGRYRFLEGSSREICLPSARMSVHLGSFFFSFDIAR